MVVADSPPVLRPGGDVRIKGLSDDQVLNFLPYYGRWDVRWRDGKMKQATPAQLNGSRAELIKYYPARGEWWVDAVYRDRYRDVQNAWWSEHLYLKAEHLELLPDLEPWDRDDYEDPHGPVFPLMRFDWAQTHPIQARAVGYRFDANGYPDSRAALPAFRARLLHRGPIIR